MQQYYAHIRRMHNNIPKNCSGKNFPASAIIPIQVITNANHIPELPEWINDANFQELDTLL